jgi:glycosyltransferase involved in cell wall biosynthesis
VITRCGGPEEFVTAADGVMVEADDSEAFAAGIVQALRRRETFNGDDMRARIVARFGRAAWHDQAMTIYERVATRGAGQRGGRA